MFSIQGQREKGKGFRISQGRERIGEISTVERTQKTGEEF